MPVGVVYFPDIDKYKRLKELFPFVKLVLDEDAVVYGSDVEKALEFCELFETMFPDPENEGS